MLTTVQQRGQNHHMKSRARRRNSASRVIRRMVPSNWRQGADAIISTHSCSSRVKAEKTSAPRPLW